MAQQQYNASNEGHVRSRKRQEERASLRKLAAFAFVMGDARGRLAIQSIIEDAGMYRNAFNPNVPQFTQYNCGMQALGQKVQVYLEDNFPDEALLMEQERLAEKVKGVREDEANRTNGVAAEQANDS
jgi:hypothetical protein